MNQYWNYFTNKHHVSFGQGSLDKLPSLAANALEHNRVKSRSKILLVTASCFTDMGVTDRVRVLLDTTRLQILDNVQPNPELNYIESMSKELMDQNIGIVVGLGGGSTIDTAKALSYVLSSGDHMSLRGHFEAGVELPNVQPFPVIAIPTTAGTGSEVTPFATIWDRECVSKYSLANSSLCPQIALLDPELTLSLPENMTVSTGLDALSQGLEAIWNRNATPITTMYALRAIKIVLDTLPRLVTNLNSISDRSKMLEASLLSGLAISTTRTALAHSISYPITARYGVPHGLACSFVLPALLEFNASADDGRLKEIAQQLGSYSVHELVKRLEHFLASLGTDARLRQYIHRIDDLIDLAPRMLTPGRADNNLHSADVGDVIEILKTAGEQVWIDEQMKENE